MTFLAEYASRKMECFYLRDITGSHSDAAIDGHSLPGVSVYAHSAFMRLSTHRRKMKIHTHGADD